MKLKGKLIRWNEERGFGFINSSSVKGDVFIHISELKHMSRRPQINDVIYFDTITTSLISKLLQKIFMAELSELFHMVTGTLVRKWSKQVMPGYIVSIVISLFVSLG